MSIQVTIGTAPCSWGVWWPDGTPSRTPYNVFLDQAAQAGYKTLELGPVGYLPTDVEQLRDELDSRGLSICGGTACYEFLKASSFADVRKDVDDLCKRLLAFDVHYMMSMDGTAFAPGEKDKLTEAKKRTFGIFAEMGRYCRETYGVEVLMHPERRSLIETPEELEELRKKEERKDRLHRNYLRRKANGKQKEWEARYNAKRKAKIEAEKAVIRAEDMAKGIYTTVSQLPHQEPQRAALPASAAI